MFSSEVDTSDIRVLKCVNDYKILIKKLKIKAFAQFHQCQYNCVKELNSQNAETCFKQCEIELDQYFEQKKQKKILKEVFYALPIYEKGVQKQYLIPEDQSFEYQKKTLIYEQQSQQKLAELKQLLDERNKKYKLW